jgi:hypothetical protein
MTCNQHSSKHTRTHELNDPRTRSFKPYSLGMTLVHEAGHWLGVSAPCAPTRLRRPQPRFPSSACARVCLCDNAWVHVVIRMCWTASCTDA